MGRFTFYCILFVALIGFVKTQNEDTTNYLSGLNPCTGTKGTPQTNIAKAHFFGCSNIPCELVKGADTRFLYKFRAVRNTPEVYNNFVGVLGSRLAPFKGFHLEPGCSNLKDDDFPGEPGCPVKKNHNYTYESTFPISKRFPSIDVIGEIGLFEADKKRPLTCFQMPLKLVTP